MPPPLHAPSAANDLLAHSPRPIRYDQEEVPSTEPRSLVRAKLRLSHFARALDPGLWTLDSVPRSRNTTHLPTAIIAGLR